MQNKTRLTISFLLFFLFLLSVVGISEPGCGVGGNFKIIEERHQPASGITLVFVEKAYDGCGNTQVYLTNSGSKTATGITGNGINVKILARENELRTGLSGNFLEPGSTTPPLLFYDYLLGPLRGADVNSFKLSAASAEGSTAEATIVLQKSNSFTPDSFIQLVLFFILLIISLFVYFYKFPKYKNIGLLFFVITGYVFLRSLNIIKQLIWSVVLLILLPILALVSYKILKDNYLTIIILFIWVAVIAESLLF